MIRKKHFREDQYQNDAMKHGLAFEEIAIETYINSLNE